MNIVGVTSEFNPFHKGHKNLLDYSKNVLKADYTIALMSGNFVQRGGPAFYSKYERTLMALKAGFDCVIEIPVSAVLSSADTYAAVSLQLMDALKINSCLFGSESGDLSLLKKCSDAISNMPMDLRNIFLMKKTEGLSYPRALSEALKDYGLINNSEEEEIRRPNNILAISYLNAINKYDLNIEPFTIKRSGGNYHDSREYAGDKLPFSSESIRNHIISLSGKRPDKELLSAIPYELVMEYTKILPHYLDIDDTNSLLKSALIKKYKDKILNRDNNELESNLDRRILNHIWNYRTPSQFLELLKSKNYTYTGISRYLMTIMLEELEPWIKTLMSPDQKPYYVRILGFRKESSKVVSRFEDNSLLPIIININKDKNKLDGRAALSMNSDLVADLAWKIIYSTKYNIEIIPELKEPYPIVI
jgi:predicted nucleotidyltransferase